MNKRQVLFVLIVLALSLVSAIAAFAQTPVPLVIDTNSLITQVNTWTTSLQDIIFLGAAIAIAIALLTFIGNAVLKAFRGQSL